VIEVREPSKKVLTADQPKKVRISEHVPNWREAVIEVQSVVKGDVPANKRVIVLFPQGNDILWKHSPKFQVGQEGTWMLHKNQTPSKHVAMWLGAQAAQDNEGYTALDPDDYQPKAQDDRVQKVLKNVQNR
jgi:hypothetical protein